MLSRLARSDPSQAPLRVAVLAHPGFRGLHATDDALIARRTETRSTVHLLMMRAAWGPLLARAIQHFALGQVRALEGRAAIGGRFGPEDLRAGVRLVQRAAKA